jgi:trehalose/maltose hydrolase-like predicted phosphorylase
VNDRNIQNLRIEAVIDRYITLINLLPENGSGLNDVGISPTGMSADSYGGMVFWDQDQWIAPNIAAMNPEYAVQILNSRVKFWEQAKTNTQMDYVKQNYTFDHNSVLYPWTSGRYGNATATGPALNYQYHLNTDIALSMLQFLRITGNESHFQQKFWPVIKSVGHTIATLLQKDGNGWSILNLTDPDEYAVSPIPPVSI